MLVKCLNCGIIWRRVTLSDGTNAGPALQDYQYYCPNCHSNAYRLLTEIEEGFLEAEISKDQERA